MAISGIGTLTWLERCACGHLMIHHDIDEHPGTELCCVEGCDQKGCPGRTPNVQTR